MIDEYADSADSPSLSPGRRGPAPSACTFLDIVDIARAWVRVGGLGFFDIWLFMG